MKKILLAVALTLAASTASAQWHRGHNHYYKYEHRSDWVAPVIVGGVIATVVLRNQPVVVEQRPVYTEKQVVYVGNQQTCTEWREVVRKDGTVAVERVCYNDRLAD